MGRYLPIGPDRYLPILPGDIFLCCGACHADGKVGWSTSRSTSSARYRAAGRGRRLLRLRTREAHRRPRRSHRAHRARHPLQGAQSPRRTRPRRVRMGGPGHRRRRGPPAAAALPGDRRGRGRPSSGDRAAHGARTEPENGVRLSAVMLEPDGGVGLEASARIRHRTAGRVDAVVLAWCQWYTADLPDDLAAERRAELASDLFEEREHSGARATGSILGGRSAASPPTSPGVGRGCAAPQSARRGARSRSPCRRSRTSPRSRSSPGAGSSSGASRAVCSSATGTAQPTSPSSRSPASSWRSSGRGCSWSRADARSPGSCSRSRRTCSSASAPTRSWRRA